MNAAKIADVEAGFAQVLDAVQPNYAEIAEVLATLAGGMLLDPDLDAPQVEALAAFLRAGLDAALAARGEETARLSCTH